MAGKQYVFIVQRSDFEHHTTRKGYLHVVEIHAQLESANVAAKAHLTKEEKKAPFGPETEESTNKDGGYVGDCKTSQDRRDRFVVEVKKVELKGAASTSAQSSSVPKLPATKKSNATAAKADDTDQDEIDEQAAGQNHKATAKKAHDKSERKTIPEGVPGALNGLKLLFTGTFDIDRATCIAAAERYGATVIKKLEDTDYVVLGVKAGDKKLQEIEAKGLETIDEDGFLQMLVEGVPEQKRAKMDAKAAESGEPAAKRRKT